MNRTLLERTRAMLRIEGLAKSFWVKAVKTSYYVINQSPSIQSPSIAISLKTLMEMWNDKSTDYFSLHIFGCPIYVMFNSQERTKLDPKSRKCIFLSYANGVNGYRLWNPTAHKVIISGDVIFS